MDLPGPFRLAKRISEESDYKIQMGAALVVGKSVIAGENLIKTHPDCGYSIHAERNCLLKARKYDIIGSSIYVYREDNNGSPAMARPCSNCMKALREKGVSRVFYSVDYYPYYESERID